MYLTIIIKYCLALFEIIISININNLPNISNKKLEIIHNDLKKTSIFSKLIYDYDYDNKYNHKKNINVDFVGEKIKDNRFLVGFGLDYNEKYRDLSFIGLLKNDNIDEEGISSN